MQHVVEVLTHDGRAAGRDRSGAFRGRHVASSRVLGRDYTPRSRRGWSLAADGWAARLSAGRSRLLGLRQEVIASVPDPAGLVVLAADRALLAVAHDRDAAGADALRDEIVHRGLRAPLAER